MKLLSVIIKTFLSSLSFTIKAIMSLEQALEIIGMSKEEYEDQFGSTEPGDLLLDNFNTTCDYFKLAISNHDLKNKYDELVDESKLERERADFQIERLKFVINAIRNRTLELNEKMHDGISNRKLIKEITWLIDHILGLYNFNEDVIKH